jgi:hypothetical protein
MKGNGVRVCKCVCVYVCVRVCVRGEGVRDGRGGLIARRKLKTKRG